MNFDEFEQLLTKVDSRKQKERKQNLCELKMKVYIHVVYSVQLQAGIETKLL